MRGCTGSHGVLQWSLSGTLGSYKGLQYRVRGLAGSQGTVQWSLDGSMGPNDVLRCHKRGYTGFQGAVHWSLSGSRGSNGIFQSHTRGCPDSPGANNGLWVVLGGPRVDCGIQYLSPYDGLHRLSGCCSMVLALSGTIDIETSVKSYTFDNI